MNIFTDLQGENPWARLALPGLDPQASVKPLSD